MKQRIIFDTDIGTDIDDAYALALILASEELDLQGVTVGFGQTDQRARLALRMLYEAGRESVPVAVGRVTSGVGEVGQAGWAASHEASQPLQQPAAEYLVEQVNRAPGEITLLAVGPLTNLADALQLDPQLPTKVAEIVMMGGCLGWPEGATPEIFPEYNIKGDIAAAQAVIACGASLLMVPTDVTMKMLLSADDRQLLAEAGNPLTEAVKGMAALEVRPAVLLHDPLAVGMVLDRTLCGLAELRVEVDDEGYTRVVPGEPNCTVALTPQTGRFMSLYKERVLNVQLGRK